MNLTAPSCLRLVLLIAVVILATRPLAAQTPEPMDQAWAEQFTGTWKLALATPGDGRMPVTLQIAPKEGGLTVRVGYPMPLGEPLADVSRAGRELVLKFGVPYEGETYRIVLRATREQDELVTRWDVVDAGMILEARATNDAGFPLSRE